MIRPKRYLLRVRGHELQFGDRTLVMGVLNVTPDSFSDGGNFADPERALDRALQMEEEGADVIDIGAESTRPGAKPVNEGEELRRLIPVLKKLEGKLRVPVSVDTYKSAVAEKALEYGVAFINDPSNLTLDLRIANVVAAQDAGLILNHMRGTPETWSKLGTMPNAAETVLAELETSVNRAQKALVDRAKILIDPGLGFGKRGEQNYELLMRLGRLRALDLPILVGPSRKSFLGQKSNDHFEADFATAAAVTAAIFEGAHMVRVHNLEAMRCAILAADAMLRNAPEEVRENAQKKSFGGMKPPMRRPYAPGEVSGVPGPRDLRPPLAPKKDETAPAPAAEQPAAAAPPAEGEAAPERKPFEERKSLEERKPFEDRKPYGDRKPFGERRDFGDRKPYGDRKDFGDRKPYGDRKDFGDRKPYGDRKDFGDRKPYADRKPYGDRNDSGERKDFGDRKPYGGPKPFGDRKPFGGPKQFGDRKPFGGPKQFGDRKPFGGPKSFGDRKPFGGPKQFGDRPFPPREGGREGGGFRGPGGPPRGPFRPKGDGFDGGGRPPRPPFRPKGPRGK